MCTHVEYAMFCLCIGSNLQLLISYHAMICKFGRLTENILFLPYSIEMAWVAAGMHPLMLPLLTLPIYTLGGRPCQGTTVIYSQCQS